MSGVCQRHVAISPLAIATFVNAERRAMMRTEIAFANERAIIADMLINLLTNVRLTYLRRPRTADAYELLLTGPCLIAQLASQPTTASEISRVLGRPRDVVTQRLDRVDRTRLRRATRQPVSIDRQFNVPNLQRHMRSNINIIQAAAKQLSAAHVTAARTTGPTLLRASEVIEAQMRTLGSSDRYRAIMNTRPSPSSPAAG